MPLGSMNHGQMVESQRTYAGSIVLGGCVTYATVYLAVFSEHGFSVSHMAAFKMWAVWAHMIGNGMSRCWCVRRLHSTLHQRGWNSGRAPAAPMAYRKGTGCAFAPVVGSLRHCIVILKPGFIGCSFAKRHFQSAVLVLCWAGRVFTNTKPNVFSSHSMWMTVDVLAGNTAARPRGQSWANIWTSTHPHICMAWRSLALNSTSRCQHLRCCLPNVNLTCLCAHNELRILSGGTHVLPHR